TDRNGLDDHGGHRDGHEGGGQAGQRKEDRREAVPPAKPPPDAGGGEVGGADRDLCHQRSPTCCSRSRAWVPSPSSAVLSGAGVRLGNTVSPAAGLMPGRSGYSQLSEVAMICWAGSLTR